MHRKATAWAIAAWSVGFCLLALAGGAGVGYFTDKGLFSSDPEIVALDFRFGFSGPLKEKHLKLSQGEVASLNRSMERAADVIKSVDVRMEIFTSRNDIRPEDTLLMTMVFSTLTGQVIQSRPQETSRRHLVARMVRYAELAEGEYRRYRGQGRNFAFLWI